jgi:hypothetical protein
MTRKERGNGHKTETPDVSHIRNVEVTHEASDISAVGTLIFAAVLAISLMVISGGVWLLFRYFNAQEAKQPQPGPMALSKDERLPPEPRLQAAPGFAVTLENGQRVKLERGAPQAEYRALRDEWQKELRGEVKDQSGNPVNMSIDQAIKQVLSGNALASRAQTAPGKLSDYAISSPTAMSSGRESEKRVQ